MVKLRRKSYEVSEMRIMFVLEIRMTVYPDTLSFKKNTSTTNQGNENKLYLFT